MFTRGPGLIRRPDGWWSAVDAPLEADTEDAVTSAGTTIGNWCRMLAANLAKIVNTLDPHAFVLGGGLSQMTEVYPVVRALMAPHVFGEVFETELLAPRLSAPPAACAARPGCGGRTKSDRRFRCPPDAGKLFYSTVPSPKE